MRKCLHPFQGDVREHGESSINGCNDGSNDDGDSC